MSKRKLTPPRDAVELLDTILEHAVDEEVDRRQSRTENEWAKRVVADVHAKIAARRLRRMPPPPVPPRAGRIPAAVLGLSRDALIAQLELRRQAGYSLAHLDLSGLTTADLQVALAEFLALERSRS